MENGCITEQEMCANVEYLVLGHFKRKEGDTATPKARTPCCGWRSLISTTRPCPTRRSTLSWTPGRSRAREFARRLGGYSVRLQLRRDDCEIGDRHVGTGWDPIGTTVPGTTVPMGPLAQAILALV